MRLVTGIEKDFERKCKMTKKLIAMRRRQAECGIMFAHLAFIFAVRKGIST